MKIIVESAIKKESKMNESRSNGEAQHTLFQRRNIAHVFLI